MSGVVLVAVPSRDDAVAVVGLDLTAGAGNDALGALEGAAPVRAESLAVLVVQGAAICDCLADPTLYRRTDGGELVARFPRVASPGGTGADAVEVGAYTDASALVQLNPTAGDLTEVERERRVMLFALRRCVRRVPEVWRVAGEGDRPAAGWPLAIAAGARVVIALGVAYIAARGLEHVTEVVTSAEQRRHQLNVQTAAVEYETRFRDWIAAGRPPGGMAPPSELARGLANRLRDDAASEWSEVIRETAWGVAKVGLVLGAAYILFRVLGSEGKGNG